jgi:hypothetical protein
MKKMMKVFATLALSAAASFALAQRGGGGIHSFGHAGHDFATADSRRALVLESTEEEREAFAHCMAAMEAARKTGRLMGDSNYWDSWRYRHLGYDLNAVYRSKDELQLALAGMVTAHQQFLEALSQEQTTELMPNLSRLEQLQGELNSQMSQLNEELTAAKPDSFHVSTRLYGIGKTIDKWRSQHRNIAKEMSIPR